MSFHTAAITTTPASAAQAEAKTKEAEFAKSPSTSAANSTTTDKVIMDIASSILIHDYNQIKKLMEQIPKSDAKKRRVEQLVYSPIHKYIRNDRNLLARFKSLKLRELAGDADATKILRSWHHVNGIIDKCLAQHANPVFRNPIQVEYSNSLFLVNIASHTDVKSEVDKSGKITLTVSNDNGSYTFECAKESQFILVFKDVAVTHVLEGYEENGQLKIKIFKLKNPNLRDDDSIVLDPQAEEIEIQNYLSEQERTSLRVDIWFGRDDYDEDQFETIMKYLETSFLVYNNAKAGGLFVNCVCSPLTMGDNPFSLNSKVHDLKEDRDSYDYFKDGIRNNPFEYRKWKNSENFNDSHRHPFVYLGWKPTNGPLCKITDCFNDGDTVVSYSHNPVTYVLDEETLKISDSVVMGQTFTLCKDLHSTIFLKKAYSDSNDLLDKKTLKISDSVVMEQTFTLCKDLHEIATIFLEAAYSDSNETTSIPFNSYKLFQIEEADRQWSPRYCLQVFGPFSSQIFIGEDGMWHSAPHQQTSKDDSETCFSNRYSLRLKGALNDIYATDATDENDQTPSNTTLWDNYEGRSYTLNLIQDPLISMSNIDFGMEEDSRVFNDTKNLSLRQAHPWSIFKTTVLMTSVLSQTLSQDVIRIIDEYDRWTYRKPQKADVIISS